MAEVLQDVRDEGLERWDELKPRLAGIENAIDARLEEGGLDGKEISEMTRSMKMVEEISIRRMQVLKEANALMMKEGQTVDIATYTARIQAIFSALGQHIFMNPSFRLAISRANTPEEADEVLNDLNIKMQPILNQAINVEVIDHQPDNNVLDYKRYNRTS